RSPGFRKARASPFQSFFVPAEDCGDQQNRPLLNHVTHVVVCLSLSAPRLFSPPGLRLNDWKYSLLETFCCLTLRGRYGQSHLKRLWSKQSLADWNTSNRLGPVCSCARTSRSGRRRGVS